MARAEPICPLLHIYPYEAMKKKLKTILEKVELLSWDCQIDDVKDELDEASFHLEAALEAYENWENTEDEGEE